MAGFSAELALLGGGTDKFGRGLYQNVNECTMFIII